MDVQNTDILPLEPFMQDGAEAQPLYELTGTLTDQDYGEFSGMHVASHQKKALGIRRINGLALATLGAFLFSYDYGLSAFAFLLGVWYFISSFFWARRVALSSAHNWDGPKKFLFRFFEDGFDSFRDREMSRRPYTDIVEMIYTGDVLYLYVGKIRAHILTSEALGSRAGELIDFLERKTGKSAMRFKWKSKR